MCEHELRMLSPPEVDVHTSVFGGGGYAYPPIYQCNKCHKVFKTGWHENSLVEILVNELTDEEKQKMMERDNGKRKSLIPWILILICCVFIIGFVGILLLFP